MHQICIWDAIDFRIYSPIRCTAICYGGSSSLFDRLSSTSQYNQDNSNGFEWIFVKFVDDNKKNLFCKQTFFPRFPRGLGKMVRMQWILWWRIKISVWSWALPAVTVPQNWWSDHIGGIRGSFKNPCKIFSTQVTAAIICYGRGFYYSCERSRFGEQYTVYI